MASIFLLPGETKPFHATLMIREKNFAWMNLPISIDILKTLNSNNWCIWKIYKEIFIIFFFEKRNSFQFWKMINEINQWINYYSNWYRKHDVIIKTRIFINCNKHNPSLNKIYFWDNRWSHFAKKNQVAEQKSQKYFSWFYYVSCNIFFLKWASKYIFVDT